MSNAIDNQLRIQDIRRRLLSHQITYDQAKTEATPIINEINDTARLLSKKYNLPARKIEFAALMR